MTWVHRIHSATSIGDVLKVSVDSSLDTSKTHEFTFNSDEIVGEIIHRGQEEHTVYASQGGTTTQQAARHPQEFEVTFRSMNDQTNARLRRMAYLISAQFKATITLLNHFGFIYDLRWATPPPHPTVYPGAGDLAYINGSTTAVVLGIAQVVAFRDESRILMPITMQCTIEMPRDRSYMAQPKGMGVSAFKEYTITFRESRQLSLPPTPSGGVVAGGGGIIGSGA